MSRSAGQQAAVGVRGGAHPEVTVGVGPQDRSIGRAGLVEQLVRTGRNASTTPASRGARGSPARRTAAPGGPAMCPCTWIPSTSSGPVQPFGLAQHDHRPARPAAVPVTVACRGLDGPDRAPGPGEGGGEARCMPGRSSPSTSMTSYPWPSSRSRTSAGSLRASTVGPAILRAVEVQDRQHGAVARRVEEGDALPRPFQRPGLGLTVPDDRERDQIRVVHHRTERVHQDVPELAALVDRPGRGHRHVAGNAAGRGELPEQPQHARPRPG